MPNTQSVCSLQAVCLRRFSHHLSEISVSGALDIGLAQRDAEKAVTYLQRSVPPCFCEELVHATLTILNKHFYNPRHKHRRPAMVAVAGWLLGQHMRCLNMDQCRMLCDRLAVAQVFQCLERMPRLETLAIGRLNFWKIPELSSLPDRLTGLSQLTTLRLEYICLPEMLVRLAEKCPRLHELSLRDSEKISNKDVPEIARCRQLRSLDISGTSVTGSGSWDILSALPLLTSFEHCPFNCNSGPFLFDSRESMLSYIWDFLSPDGRVYSASLPSVTRHLAQPPAVAEVDAEVAESDAGVAEADEDAAEADEGGTAGADAADDMGGESAAADPDQSPPAAAAGDSTSAASLPVVVDEAARRDSSADATASSASSSSRHVLPLPLSRSGSGVLAARPFLIENFWLFNPKTEEVALARLCPAVRRLRLDFVFQDMGVSPEWSGLTQFRHVTQLSMSSYDAPRYTVLRDVLRLLGAGLVTLSLHVCDDYAATAELENAVARWCPCLERYSFTGDYGVRQPPGAHGDDELEFSLPARHTQLRELTVGGFASGRRLLFLLAHARRLRSLRLDGELRHLQDAGFQQVLAVNALTQLEELWVNVSSGLTMASLLPLVFDPESRLRRLGRLSSLQGLNRKQFLELRDQTKALNLDLDLVWVTPGV